MAVLSRRHLQRRAERSVASAAHRAAVAAATSAPGDAGNDRFTDTAGTGSGSDGDDDDTAQQAHRPAPERPLGLHFPSGFRWGAATSAYQIEGGAKEDGRGESVWDTFSHTPGRTRAGDTGDVAADHYHRYDDDLDLMRDLGLHSYRFSISWPRIQPDGTGKPNQRGLDFYRRLIDGLTARGIEPMATLFHWDLPQALQDVGGWESRDVAYRFADYAQSLFHALGDAVPVWLTINEPKTVVQNGYLSGHHAPGRSDPDAAYLVAHHLQLAHGLAVQALRANRAACRIGPAFNLHPCYPADDSPAAAAPRGSTTAMRTGSTWTRSSWAATPPTCWPISARKAGWHVASATATSRSSPRRSTCSPSSTTHRSTSPATAGRYDGGRRRKPPGSRSTRTACSTSSPRSTATTVRYRSPSPRTGCPRRTGWHPTARWTIRAGSVSCATTWPPSTGRSAPASRWRATTSGHSWTTSNGTKGTSNAGA